MFDIPPEFPRDWYWVVGSDEGRAWSSAAGEYVTDYPLGSVTRILNEQELTDVLKALGMPGPVLTQTDYSDAIQAHVDAAARSHSYADAESLASYVSSTVPGWAAEAQAFVAWRDAVWVHAHTELARVLAGERAQPTVMSLIAELPAIEWPA